MKRNYRKMIMVASLIFFIGMSQTALNAEESTNSTTIDTETFTQWELANVTLREDRDSYIKVQDKTILLFSTADKLIWCFYTPSIPCENGRQVEFTFNAEGSGKGQVGFFAYENEKWTQTDGMKLENFIVEKDAKKFHFTLPVKGDKIKAIRLVIGANPQSEVKFSDLKINIK